MTTQTIREYLAHIWANYQVASKALKSEILNEVCRNLSIHRKAAIRLLKKEYKPRSLQGFRGGRRKKYSEASKIHLENLWKVMGYMAPIRMKAALPEWIDFYEHKDFTSEIRSEILAMSEASIKRFLSKARSDLQRKINSGTRGGLKRFVTKVPIRNLGESPTEPGHCEIDCVAHCGGSLSGEFAWTLNLTDICTGWTECESIWAKTGHEVKRALKAIEARLPFALKALYSDNGSEFMNHDVIDKFTTDGRKVRLPYYRSRPYKKNDQCYIEQKNYTHVRHLFGYGRISWKKSVPMMNSIYRKEWSQLQNLYMPQQKLDSKHRIGARQIRKMSTPVTPYLRLMPFLNDQDARKLTNTKLSIDPIRTKKSLIQKVRNMFGYLKDTINKSEWGKIIL